jgi:hypothetical protein
MDPEPGSLAKYFDGWYADMAGSPVKDEIQQRHLGLPPCLLSTSLLGWDGITEAAASLRLSAGSTLVDMACGRGGYGLEIAARSRARLVGVGFSAEAVRQAREQGRRLGATADSGIGDLAATGLDAGSHHADQFRSLQPPPAVALAAQRDRPLLRVGPALEGQGERTPSRRSALQSGEGSLSWWPRILDVLSRSARGL